MKRLTSVLLAVVTTVFIPLSVMALSLVAEGYSTLSPVLYEDIYGNTREKNVTLYYRNITADLDGVQLDFTDSNGAYCEPFVYDNSVYVPLRSMAESFGKEVVWYQYANHAEILSKPDELKGISPCVKIQYSNYTLRIYDNGTVLFNSGINELYHSNDKYLDDMVQVKSQEYKLEVSEETVLYVNGLISKQVEFVEALPEKSVSLYGTDNSVGKAYDGLGTFDVFVWLDDRQVYFSEEYMCEEFEKALDIMKSWVRM